MGESGAGRYFDSAATSHPKSEGVFRRMRESLTLGGTYGRSLYARTLQSSRVVEEAREAVSRELGVRDARCVSFTSGATEGLNAVLLGYRYRKGRVLLTPLEHNAVYRPLAHLQSRDGLAFEFFPTDAYGRIDLDALSKDWADRFDLAVVNHASNVSGVVQPVSELRGRLGDLPLLLDASQTAGHICLDAEGWGLDWLACPGHKGLGGPTGTGCLYVRDSSSLLPFRWGGTGLDSGGGDMPVVGPSRWEAGTPNLVGIAGLLGALEDRFSARHSWADFCWFRDEVRALRGVRVLWGGEMSEGVELFSIVPLGMSPGELSYRLAQGWGFETRSGLHCAWCAHDFYGTLPDGASRVSLSPLHTRDDLSFFLGALRECVSG